MKLYNIFIVFVILQDNNSFVEILSFCFNLNK